jgi:hypothetical protein
MREMETRQATVFPQAESDTFEERFKARMAQLGSKGGKKSGVARMKKLTAQQRSEIALKAAMARWDKKRKR